MKDPRRCLLCGRPLPPQGWLMNWLNPVPPTHHPGRDPECWRMFMERLDR